MSDDYSTLHRHRQSMDSSTEVAAGRATVGPGQLHTPQEQRHDSFTHEDGQSEKATNLAPIRTLSPPISPVDIALANFKLSTSQSHADPPLFPESTPNEEQTPLFESQGEQVEAPPTETVSPRTLPSLPISVPGTIIPIEPTREAAFRYYMDNMAQLDRMRDAQRAAGTLPYPQRSVGSQPRDPETTRQLGLLTQPAGITKTRSPAKSVPKPKAPRAAQATPPRESTPEQRQSHLRRSRTPRQRPQKKDMDFYSDAFPGDNDKKHKRAAPSKHTASKEEDLRWRELADYSPPVETLDDPALKLRASWVQTQSALKIDDEGDADQLHSQELKLSETLRLKPVQYLANKRRIFEAKVKAVQESKPFTKTAAQNVTNIDVNKASRLWEAFDNVGWFKHEWFVKWLPNDAKDVKNE